MQSLGLFEEGDAVERQEFLGLQSVVSDGVADIETRFNRVFALHPSQSVQELQRVLRTQAREERRTRRRSEIRCWSAAPERRAYEGGEAVSTTERIGLRAVEGDAKFVQQVCA